MATINELLNILPTSKDQAITAEDIARRLGYPTNNTQVKARNELITPAIEQGHLILSTSTGHSKGYWLSNDKQEVKEYLASLDSRVRKTTERKINIKDTWNATHPTDTI